jgi:hypothetical protein
VSTRYSRWLPSTRTWTSPASRRTFEVLGGGGSGQRDRLGKLRICN